MWEGASDVIWGRLYCRRSGRLAAGLRARAADAAPAQLRACKGAPWAQPEGLAGAARDCRRAAALDPGSAKAWARGGRA